MSTPLDNDDLKLEAIRMQNDGATFTAIGLAIGVHRKTVTQFLNRVTHTGWWARYEKPIASGKLHDHHHKMINLEGKKFLITSAQNNTFVHAKFLKSLELYAKMIDAQIIVGTFSYNKNGFQGLEKGDGEWFDTKIEQYIIDEPVRLAKDLIWCGELNILPTVANPLSGFHGYSKSGSSIIPHAKMQLESLPRHANAKPRFAYTTGAVTQRNYIQKSSGQKASFHHIFGALIVEIDDAGDWFVRQLSADANTGCFYDLDNHVTPEYVNVTSEVEAINWGDIHAEKLDCQVAIASFVSSDSILDTLKPKYQFANDILDFESRNHHSINDPYFRYNAFVSGKDSVVKNIKSVVNVLELMNRDYCLTVIVESNHDLALQRWLKTADYKTDPANAVFFLECQLATYKAIQCGKSEFSIFNWALNRVGMSHELHVKCLRTDESFMICGDEGIECGMHGHLGINGSRGGAAGFARLGSRTNVGHSHSAKIVDGVYYAGVTGMLKMGYNKGITTWSNSHIVTHVDGSRQIITIINGKWRA